jgi:riboflavin biosynthesis pyrimidine reductase
VILTRVPVGDAADLERESSSPVSVDTEADDARARLAALYAPPRRRWLRVNLVMSVDGSAVGADGGSDSLTNPADRMLMGVIRSSADVVLVGAASIRREGLHLPTRARLAIVMATGDLGDLEVPDGLASGRVIVAGPEDATAAVARRYPGLRAEPIVLGPGEALADGEPTSRMPSTAAIVEALRLRGAESILSEGGPTLVGGLLDAGLVDELCLTTSPVLSSSHLPLSDTVSRPGQRLDLPLDAIQLLVDERGGTYARWSIAGRWADAVRR